MQRTHVFGEVVQCGSRRMDILSESGLKHPSQDVCEYLTEVGFTNDDIWDFIVKGGWESFRSRVFTLGISQWLRMKKYQMYGDHVDFSWLNAVISEKNKDDGHITTSDAENSYLFNLRKMQGYKDLRWVTTASELIYHGHVGVEMQDAHSFIIYKDRVTGVPKMEDCSKGLHIIMDYEKYKQIGDYHTNQHWMIQKAPAMTKNNAIEFYDQVTSRFNIKTEMTAVNIIPTDYLD